MAEEGNLDQGNSGDTSADAVAAAAAAKVAEGGDGDAVTPEAKAAVAEAAKPIEYVAFEMPEGMEVDKTALEAFQPLLQSGKVSQEDAQKYVNIMSDAAKRQTEAHTKAWNDAMGKWQEEAKADPEIGGTNWERTQARISLALKKLSPPNSKDENGKDLGTNPLEEIFKTTGMGNHVEMSRFLEKVGTILEDDKIDLGHALGESAKSPEDIMYPNQGK